MNCSAMVIYFSGLLACCSAANTQCYVCSSILDSTCADEYVSPSNHEKDCGTYLFGIYDDGSCSKSKSITKALGSTTTVVTRSCGKLFNNDYCAKAEHMKGVDGYLCSCHGDKCNGGSQFKASVYFLVSALTATVFFY
ncbi:hypothetical protein EB796_017348 [Bugula neritina]|uniref:Protein sleepless n=1 Tax=Bugula neritina TaxID=10212 RepID=A0A7J7JE89_BUGNE|nr:hypothetical protein EB796_017348 [Bugula neritina]